MDEHLDERPEINKGVKKIEEIKPEIRKPTANDNYSDKTELPENKLVTQELTGFLEKNKFRDALLFIKNLFGFKRRNEPPSRLLPSTPAQESSKTYSLEQWQKDTSRLIRRAAIGRYLQGSKSQEEVKAAVRKYESEIGVKDLIDDLTTKEVNVPPEIAKVTTALYEKIRLKVPKVQAIILLGSSAHGGAKIREAMGDEQEPDLDWYVICESGYFTRRELKDVTDEAENCLPQIAEENGLSPSFHSCLGLNPLHNPRINSLRDTKDVFSLIDLRSIFYKKFKQYRSTFALYLQPSFPPQVNERNRKILKAGLDELYIQDKDKWTTVMANIISEWKNIHNLKPKHFSDRFQIWHDLLPDEYIENFGRVGNLPLKKLLTGEEDTEGLEALRLELEAMKKSKDFKIAESVVKNSGQVMSQPMAESLKST